MSFRALVLTQADRKVSGAIETLDDSRLPAGDVTRSLFATVFLKLTT